MPSSDRNLRVGVIGGGVSGLSTALALKNQFRNMVIDVISDKEYSDTTSFGPPGLFRPHGNAEPDLSWAKVTLERNLELWKSGDAYESGIQLVSGYCIAEENDLDWCKSQLTGIELDYHWLKEDEMTIFPKRYKHGYHCTGFTLEGRLYGPYLQNKLLSLGVNFVKKHVTSINLIAPNYDFIINCSGLNARELVGDTHMKPQRGVMLRVDAPWMKHYIVADKGTTYVIPGRDTVFLGGYRQLGREDLLITDFERNDIRDRVASVVPALKNAPVVDEWCGLRPYREGGVRLEMDKTRTYNLPVIHNYGHAGNGFVLSWGCAQNVVQIMLKLLDFAAKL